MDDLADYLISQGKEEDEHYQIGDWTIHIMDYLEEKHKFESKLDVIIEQKTGKPVEVN
jgi:hypothetical protein